MEKREPDLSAAQPIGAHWARAFAAASVGVCVVATAVVAWRIVESWPRTEPPTEFALLMDACDRQGVGVTHCVCLKIWEGSPHYAGPVQGCLREQALGWPVVHRYPAEMITAPAASTGFTYGIGGPEE